MMRIRPPAVSGRFYPSDPTLLALQVDAFLEEQEQAVLQGTVLGLVAPHAGYIYSGRTAGAAYALLRRRRFNTAVIVAPSHCESFNGISIYDGDAYRTPLGIVEVDADMRNRLLRNKGLLTPSCFGHRGEHAIEVHLPFLQRVNPDARILPVCMGDQGGEMCLMLGRILAESAGGDETILIASSDLSHMHDDSEARRLDAIAERHILGMSVSGLLKDLSAHRTEACGGGPVCAVMHAAMLLGADKALILRTSNSGDASGDRSKVVGYLSAAFLRGAADEGGPR